MDESTLAKDLNLKSVHLMSDLEAVARAVPTCKLRSCSLLIQGEPVAHGTIAIVTTCAALVGAAAYGLKRLKSIANRA